MEFSFLEHYVIFLYIQKKGCKNTIFLVPTAFFVFLPQISKMFYYLNKNTIVQWILIAMLFAWSVFTIVTEISVCPADGQSIFFQYLVSFWTGHPLHLKVVSIVLLLLESLLIGYFYSANRFADNKTIIPVVFFLLMMNVGGFLKVFTPAVITLVLTTLIVIVNTQDENERPVKNRVLTSGFLLGISALFDPVSVVCVLFLTMALITHRYSKSKEIAIMLFGLLFVCAYLFSGFFIADKMPVLMDSFKHLSFFGVIKSVKTLDVFDYVLVGYIVVLAVYLIVQLKLFYDNRLIVLRKRLVTIHLLLFVLVAVLLLSGLQLQQGLLYLTFPITMYFSMITLYRSRIVFHDILILAFYILLWL